MRLLHRAGLVLGLAAAAACNDSVSPKSLANPQQTTEQMAAFDTLFNAAVLNSFSALSFYLTPNPVAARDLAAAANPLASSSALRPYSTGLETSQMLRRLAPSLITMSAEDLFPVELDGKTFEWNTTSTPPGYAPTARTGAPTDGIRFILYAVDPLTGLPVEPLVEVGYAEFDDESTASLDKVHVRVVGSTGTVYVDYTVSVASLSETSARLEAAGYLTNAADSPDTLDFSGTVNISFAGTTAAVTQDVSFDVDSHDAHARLWERVTFDLGSGEGTIRIFFSFTHGTETVTVDANFAVTETTVNGTMAFKVDGGPFATCTVEAAPGSYSLNCVGADADGLNVAETQAIDAIGDGLASIETVFQSILGPASGVLGGAQ